MNIKYRRYGGVNEIGTFQNHDFTPPNPYRIAMELKEIRKEIMSEHRIFKIYSQKLMHWVPRVLAMLFIGFISLFALDVFSMEGSFLNKMGGFFIHLIPTYFLIAAFLISLKYRKIGGIIFIVYSLFFLGYGMPFVKLTFFPTLFLTGILYIFDEYFERRWVK